ncbi:MAG: TIGR04086 family membrane protein [Acutalibacteraceae bacterium]|nr:TIGR04086 family membrane protein [Acutalibacteraceae bacterium]
MDENKIKYITLIKTILIFTLVFFTAVFLFAVVLYLLEGGYELSPLFATLSIAMGCFAASLYLGNYKGEKGILVGGAVALVIFIITSVISLLVNDGSFSIHLLLRFVIILLASLIGAIIGVNKKINKKFI